MNIEVCSIPHTHSAARKPTTISIRKTYPDRSYNVKLFTVSSPAVKWENQPWTQTPTSSNPGSIHRSVWSAADRLHTLNNTRLFLHYCYKFSLFMNPFISPNQPTPRPPLVLRASPAPPLSSSSPRLSTARQSASPKCIRSHPSARECRWDTRLHAGMTDVLLSTQTITLSTEPVQN